MVPQPLTPSPSASEPHSLLCALPEANFKSFLDFLLLSITHSSHFHTGCAKAR